MHSIKRGSRSFARSIVSEKLLCRWVAPPAGRVAQIFIGTGARLGIREPSAKTPADMGYFAVQMWLTVRYLQVDLFIREDGPETPCKWTSYPEIYRSVFIGVSVCLA